MIRDPIEGGKETVVGAVGQEKWAMSVPDVREQMIVAATRSLR
jgi:hypothetical protein